MATRYHSSFDKTLNFTDTCAQFTLTANNVQTYTVPGTADQKFTLLFSYNSNQDVFVGYNVTAAIPAPNTNTTLSQVEYKPFDSRWVIGGDVLSFITPNATTYLGISLRSVTN